MSRLLIIKRLLQHNGLMLRSCYYQLSIITVCRDGLKNFFRGRQLTTTLYRHIEKNRQSQTKINRDSLSGCQTHVCIMHSDYMHNGPTTLPGRTQNAFKFRQSLCRGTQLNESIITSEFSCHDFNFHIEFHKDP